MIRLLTASDAQTQLSHSQIARILVPTMGALHDGHFKLIEMARDLVGSKGEVIVSIFVNPIQFDKQGDLDSYPQPIEEDLAHCERLGVNAVFTPDARQLYHSDRSITVQESSLSALLCGATRPGHFDGVCTVISKLFNIIQPTHAIFGEKDYQQLAIIRRLVRDLNYPVKIIGCPTVRESSGLALASRNLRLTEDAKAQAPAIRQAMLLAQKSHIKGEHKASNLLQIIRDHLASQAPMSKIDYLECVCAETLQAVKTTDKPSVIAIAAFFGDVRLIDNIQL